MIAQEVAVGTELTDWPELYQERVLSKCSDVNAPGRWLCLTHRQTMQHNADLQSHCESGQHVVAWYCTAHGVETP